MSYFKKILSSVLVFAVLLGGGMAFAADEVMERDENRVPVSGAVTNDANTEIVQLRVDPTTKALLVTSSTTAPTSITYDSGRKVVASAGTAEAISASTDTFIECDFQAEENNTGDIVIGGSGVIAALATREGVLLTPGTSFRMGVPGDRVSIFIDSEISGDGVTFLCQS